MPAFRSVFRQKKVFLPVIHVTKELDTAHNDAVMAQKRGADGVFLISHGYVNHLTLTALAETIAREVPDLWIGVNFLGDDVNIAIRRLQGKPFLKGLWADKNLWTGDQQHDEAVLPFVQKARKSVPHALFFGGLAFKYQSHVPEADLAFVAQNTLPYTDVVTTSGPGTGEPANVGRLATIRHAIGPEPPLALASGVTLANLDLYLPLIDCFLVSTGISDRDSDRLIPSQVEEMASRIHTYRP